MPTRDGARSPQPPRSPGPSFDAEAQSPAETGAKPPLPPGLDLLWGRREGGSRGPRRGLSVDEIVRAAVRIADRDGLEGVSMARVAEELGFTTMSLYRYVASKDELLQLMWNASAQGAAELQLHGTGWRAQLREWAVIQRDVLDRHPWLTQMPMAAPPLAPNSLRFVEIGLGALDDTGLTDGDKIRIIGLLSSYTLSEGRMAHDAASAAAQAAAAGTAAPAPPWSFEALLRELVTEQEYPRLHRLAWAEAIGDSPSGVEEREEFLFGVERILDGTQALIDKATRKDSPSS
ncbi:MAG TPA: TetR/AcrR family transcriptional regulator [Streptosporangiaceae bacterium]